MSLLSPYCAGLIWNKALGYQTHFKEDKVICILKRAVCSDQEWENYKQKVESEMEMEDFLEDLGKVLEAAHRLTQNTKEL